MQNHPHIVATIEFHSEENGGRSSSLPHNIFRCLFGFEGEQFSCAVLPKEGEALTSGKNAEIFIVFYFPQYIKSRLKPGDRFTLGEPAAIADGVVEKVL